MTDFITSIVAIRKEQDGGHAEVSINGDNFDTLIWHDGNPTNITQQQILDKQVELKADFAAKQYQIDRKMHPDDGALRAGCPRVTAF